jgi:hypothetical protein
MTMAPFAAYVPVLLLLMVTVFSLLLRPRSAAGRLTVATGGLVVVVMIHAVQAAAQPAHEGLSRFDAFMAGTYVACVANVAFSVLMLRFEEDRNRRMAELMYLLAAGAVPGLLLLSWTAVFSRLV